MSKTISSNNHYVTSAQSRLYLIMPRWYIGIFSRGTGKTTVMQALRSYLTAINVPQGLSVFYNATYIGAQQRTVANTIAGWKQLGLQEGIDFVKNIKPPPHFADNPFYEPLNWKNTISWKNGHIFVIGSNDRPGLVNSLSITGGIFIDECRFLNEELMAQDLYPAIRGKHIWAKNNPFVFSRTYTTDMPFISDDADWLFDFEELMIPEQIKLIAQASIKVEKSKNKIFQYRKLYKKSDSYTAKQQYLHKINNLEKGLQTKLNFLNTIRTAFVVTTNGKQELVNKSVYFDTGSFLANLNILGKDYFFNNANSKRNPLIAKTSFLNIRPKEVENMFYSNLSSKHFITGTFDTTLYNMGIADIADTSPIKAKHIIEYKPNVELDIEFDYGDMCTCSVSQKIGREELYIATFEVLLPYDIDDLIDIVVRFFDTHTYKRINVYKDPSGNYQRNRSNQTYGPRTMEKLREHGWYAIDRCPTGSINASHNDKHQLLSMILKEQDARLPQVRIIRETNRNLESSLNIAPLIVKIDRDGKKTLHKDKSSEKKLQLQDKPARSTDHSDHFDIKLWHKYKHLLSSMSITYE